mgnify:FL=1
MTRGGLGILALYKARPAYKICVHIQEYNGKTSPTEKLFPVERKFVFAKKSEVLIEL